MRSCIILVGIALAFLSHPAGAYSMLPSEISGWAWYQSTVLGGVGQPATKNGEELTLPVPGTGRGLSAILWKGSGRGGPKGLILLLPGTGGGPGSGLANQFAEVASLTGFDVVVLANPFSPEFQKSFSPDGIVGLPQRDLMPAAKMLRAAAEVHARLRGEPRKIVLAGISLGALYASLEAREAVSGLRFDQVLLLNPPPSLQYGITQLDDMIRVSLSRDVNLPFNFPVIWAFLQAQKGVNLANLAGIRMFLPQDEVEGRKLIGDSFRFSLMEIGREMLRLNRDSLGPNVEKKLRENYGNMTFERFIGYAGTELVARNELSGGVSEAFDGMKLAHLLRGTRARGRITVITNVDDFLLRAGDLDRLEKLLGERLHVFDGGGHCGNYWTPSFRKLLAKVLGGPAREE